MNPSTKYSASDPALLLVNISQLLTLRSRSEEPGPRRGADLGELGIIKDGAVLCVGDKIVSACKTKDALRDPWIRKNRKKIVEIDCAGQVVLPGFVDSHTHPVFVAPRLVDFEKRITGATYEQIAEAGGGIRSSVEGVRKAGMKLLVDKVLDALHEMAEQGTTTVEAKSGYGLTVESEIKSLEAIRKAAAKWPGRWSPTLLGAHVVPREFQGRAQEYVELVCSEMIPQVARRKLAQFVDVFTDRGAFTAEDTEKIFDSCQETRSGSAGPRLPVERDSVAAAVAIQRRLLRSHGSRERCRHHATGKGRNRGNAGAGRELFPGPGEISAGPQVDRRRRRRRAGHGLQSGLVSDAQHAVCAVLACTHLKMSPAEAIAAATINGAWALRLQERKGSIEPGKDADLAVFDVADYREIAYWVASNRCAFTVLNGAVAASRSSH